MKKSVNEECNKIYIDKLFDRSQNSDIRYPISDIGPQTSDIRLQKSDLCFPTSKLALYGKAKKAFQSNFNTFV